MGEEKLPRFMKIDKKKKEFIIAPVSEDGEGRYEIIVEVSDEQGQKREY